MKVKKGIRYSLAKSHRSFIVAKRRVVGSVQLHSHAYFELELIISGECEAIVNGKAHILSEGCVHLAGPMDYHEIKARKNGPELFNVSFVSDGKLSRQIDNIFGNPLVKTIKLTLADLSICKHLCEILLAEQDDQASDDNVAEPCFEALVNKITRYVPMSGEQNAHTAKAVRYIQEHFNEDLTLSSVAREIGFSDAYLSALFKRAIGTGLKRYLTLLRITHARRLLETTDMNATDICYECGFRSYSGFFRAFKKITGFPPNRHSAVRDANTED